MVHFMDSDKRLLKVIFSPWYEAENPYQRKLAAQLETLNVQVEGTSCGTAVLLKTVTSQNVDVLHLHWLQHFFLREDSNIRAALKLILFISQLILLRTRKIKIIWTVHNLTNHKNQHINLDRMGSFAVSRIAHKLIVHSETAKQDLRHWLWLSREIDVIPHASYVGDYENSITRLVSREKLYIRDSTLVFLFFGLLHPYKGVLELAQSFDRLQLSDSCLVIVGQTKDEQLDVQLRKISSQNATIRYIPGFVPEDQVQLYMNASDVVALPYRQVLTSGAVNLAMSFGKACLAPDKGYISELLDDKGAFLYDSKTADGLEKAMRAVEQHRHHLKSMGAYNFQLAKQKTWSMMAKDTLNVYRSV